jgi:hypothetical protein
MAQYNYALAMREVALTRQKRLNASSQRERSSARTIPESCKATPTSCWRLLARMESDHQQYRTLHGAYAARLTYLWTLHEALGKQGLERHQRGCRRGRGFGGLAALKGSSTHSSPRSGVDETAMSLSVWTRRKK